MCVCVCSWVLYLKSKTHTQTSVNANSVPIFSISISSSRFKIHASKAVMRPETILATNGVLNTGKSLDKNLNSRPSLDME